MKRLHVHRNVLQGVGHLMMKFEVSHEAYAYVGLDSVHFLLS